MTYEEELKAQMIRNRRYQDGEFQRLSTASLIIEAYKQGLQSYEETIELLMSKCRRSRDTAKINIAKNVEYDYGYKHHSKEKPQGRGLWH